MNTFSKISMIALVALLSACAGIRGNQLGEITGWPPETKNKKSISYVITGKIDMNGNVADAQPAALNLWKQNVEKAYKESEIFSSVSDGFSDTDIRAEISITDKGRGSMALAFLSGFTFGVIPSYANDEFIVNTTFKDRNGNVLASISKQEDVSQWIQILLLPVTPFAFPTSQVNGALYDIHRSTLLTYTQHQDQTGMHTSSVMQPVVEATKASPMSAPATPSSVSRSAANPSTNTEVEMPAATAKPVSVLPPPSRAYATPKKVGSTPKEGDVTPKEGMIGCSEKYKHLFFGCE